MRRAIALAALLLVVAPTVGAAGVLDTDGDGLSDYFERRWGLTDPRQADSDGDGLVDSAEDNDADRLSNLGEQRFKSDPTNSDTDSDGRSDGREDRDRDGRSNALEQDQRPIPRGLKPSLATAKSDYPEGKFTCQADRGQSEVMTCAFGDETSDITLVLFGDSHASQWLPALDRAGEHAGWKVIQLTKAACPSSTLRVHIQYKQDRGESCRRWRANALQWLAEHPPDVILISNLSWYTLVNSKGRKVRWANRPRPWERGHASTLAALPSSSKVVVLADTPRVHDELIDCLQHHRSNISACATRRPRAFGSNIRAVERQASRAAGAAYRSLNDLVCSYDPCPIIHGRILAWRDHGHLTATFSASLWPSMEARLRSATSGVLTPARKRR